MIKSALNPDDKDRTRWAKAEREWRLVFLRSPRHFLSDETGTRVAGVRFDVNRLEVRIVFTPQLLKAIQVLFSPMAWAVSQKP